MELDIYNECSYKNKELLFKVPAYDCVAHLAEE